MFSHGCQHSKPFDLQLARNSRIVSYLTSCSWSHLLPPRVVLPWSSWADVGCVQSWSLCFSCRGRESIPLVTRPFKRCIFWNIRRSRYILGLFGWKTVRYIRVNLIFCMKKLHVLMWRSSFHLFPFLRKTAICSEVGDSFSGGKVLQPVCGSTEFRLWLNASPICVRSVYLSIIPPFSILLSPDNFPFGLVLAFCLTSRLLT